MQERIIWIDPCNKGRYKAICHFIHTDGSVRQRYMDAKDLDIFLDFNDFP